MAQSPLTSTSQKLTFELQPEDGGVAYVDLAQCLSIVNRRSYRQGMNYAVQSIEFVSNASSRISVFTIPTSWPADNATTKMFEAWKDQRAEVLKEQPSLKAAWSDFKIFMDDIHAAAGTAGNLLPAYYDSNNAYFVTDYVAGDWDASQFVLPIDGGSGGLANAQEVTMHVVGDHFPPGNFNNATISAGLVKSYQDSRAVILAPDPVSPAGFTTNLFSRSTSHDEMSADIQQNVSKNNDNPPYPIVDYPGGDTQAPVAQFVDTAFLTNFGDTTQYSIDTVPATIVPFGLLKFLFTTSAPGQSITMHVHLAPGNYKGVLAERGV